jgi:hypothetical protein
VAREYGKCRRRRRERKYCFGDCVSDYMYAYR